MSVSFIFWFVWLLVLIWSIAYHGWGWGGTYAPRVNAAVIMLLFFCVGVGVFGWPIKG
jgi:hypothetical protein